MEMEPILKEKRRVHVIGHSRLVVLPKWWIQNEEEVELEVFSDKVIIRKGGEKE